MYIETSSPRVDGDKARLIGPSYPSTTTSCLKFYYRMYGSNINTLNVYIRTGTTLGPPVWSLVGNQGYQWLLARIPVASESVWQVLHILGLKFRVQNQK